MDYIVSARKYRPMTFSSVVGQGSLTTTLRNAVTSGKLAHAYLFCGPRGVGKTTCARIFAKVINCQNPTAAGDACGECESCKAFNEGRSLNIFELDAASNNGVEHIKTLMEQTHIPPQTGRYKVFIIDEVHMLSTQAFNAFLKTLEEPPAHVIFILATTEKHKILPTILSRCQIYDFERMSVGDIIKHLKHVADQEGITYEEAALNIIAEKADGGMRDALSIFDQAASFCQGNITYEKVLEDLNVLDVENYFNIVKLALQNKVSDLMLVVNNILSRGFDGQHLVNGLASHVRNLLMAANPQTTQLIEASDAARQRYAEQAKECPKRFLYSALKILNQCDINYRISSNKRLLVELTIIQVAQITQGEDSDEGSGLRPCIRLKNIFQTIVPTAKEERPVAKTTPVTNNIVAEQVKEFKTARSSTLLKDIGFSFKGLRDRNSANTNTDKTSVSNPDDNEPFTLEDARREWLTIINIMRQDKSQFALSQRMKNIHLKMDEFPNLVGVAENSVLYTDIVPRQDSLQAELARRLHNGHLTLVFSLEAKKKTKDLAPITQEEFFETLSREEMSFSDMRKELQLELE